MLQDYLLRRLLDGSSIGQKIQSTNDVSEKGQFALDATDKNPNIEGSLAGQIEELKTQTTVLRESVNNIVALPEGATSEDGQIEDAKIGIEGETYPTLGESIRSQITTYRDVAVSNAEPTGKEKVWVNTSENEVEGSTIQLPQIDDESISVEDTWSSEKISTEIKRLSGIDPDIRIPQIIDTKVSVKDTWSSEKISTEIEKLAGTVPDVDIPQIDDTGVSVDSVWSSSKVNSELTNLSNDKVSKEEGKGLFSGSYNDLTDVPEPPAIPTKVSELENDSNYATKGELPTKTSQLTNDSKFAYVSDIPTKVSELNNDRNYLVRSDISNLDNHVIDTDNPHKVLKSQVGLGNVDNTSDADKPLSIAQKKYIDDSYANSNAYTDQKIADLIGGAPETLDTLKEVSDAIAESKDVETALNNAIGTKANQTELDTHTGNDTIHITADERTNWNDANSKQHTHSNKSILDKITQTLLDAWDAAYTHISDTVKHITSDERTSWNNKYAKPSGGIPKTDLASAVQTSLGKADTALQAHQDISGLATKTEFDKLNSNLSVICKYKQLLNPVFAKGWGCNGVVNNDGKIILTATNSYPSIIGYLAKFTFKANKTYHIRAFDLNNVVYINGNLASDENSNVFTLSEVSNNWYKKYTPTEDTEVQFLVYFNNKTIGATASCYISVSELYTDEYLPYTGDGETLTHDVAELKNDLAKLFSSNITGIKLNGSTLEVSFNNGTSVGKVSFEGIIEEETILS